MSKNKRYLLYIGLFSIFILYLLRDQTDIKTIELMIKDSGYLAPAIFMVIYFISSLLLFPVLLLTILSGALFGPYLGTLYTIVSATISATAALLIARYLAHDWVEQKSGKITKKIINGVNKEGWHFVAFIRLVPIFPFTLVNYAFGLTKIRILPYMVTSFICMLPASFAYSYLGFLGMSTATDDTDQLISKIFMVIALFACIAFITKIAKKKRQKK